MFVLGAYAGISLMAMLAVTGREPPLEDALNQMGDLPLPQTAGAMRMTETPAPRPNREPRTRKRDEPRRRMPDPVEQQGNLQW